MILGLLLAAGCGSGSKEAGKAAEGANTGQKDPKVGGTLIIGTGADATGLDPELVLNNESGFPMSLLYDRLR